MADQVNAVVAVDAARLDLPLRPLKARRWHNFVAELRRVPADVTAVFLRLFRENGAYFDVPARERRGGGWTARVPAACLPDAGEFRYEVHATAADDQPAALGEGTLSVAPFSVSSAPVEPGAVQEVAQLPCEGGGFVQVVMRWDGHEWMPEAVADGGKAES